MGTNLEVLQMTNLDEIKTRREKINGIDYGHVMDISVKDFNSYLFNSLKEGLNVTT